MTEPAIQDLYPEDVAVCYGCGRLNEHGLQIKSRWEGDEAVCRFRPQPHHEAFPGIVYGGLLASLIDCHAIGTASAAAHVAAGRRLGEGAFQRFVTASLTVDYLKPTPIGEELELRGRAVEIGERKVVVEVTVSAAGRATARGRVVAVRPPEHLFER